MNDRYEEFKKWVIKKSVNFEQIEGVSSTINLLIEFENEQFKMGKEKEIKTIIALEISDYSSDYPSNTVEKKVDSIYKKLKERGLIN